MKFNVGDVIEIYMSEGVRRGIRWHNADALTLLRGTIAVKIVEATLDRVIPYRVIPISAEDIRIVNPADPCFWVLAEEVVGGNDD